MALAGMVQSQDLLWWLGLALGAFVALLGVQVALPVERGPRRWTVQAGAVLLVGFVALSLQLARFQVVDVRSTLAGAENPLARGDPRIQLLQERTYRGALLDRQGVVLARSQPSGEVMLRSYPLNRWGNLLGYYSPRLLGKGGLELSLDAFLAGRQGGDWSTWLYRILGRPVPGNDVWLTLDSRLQEGADTLLGGRRGAIIVLDARTGAVLAAVSSPDFPPAELSDDFSQPRGQDAERVLTNWQKLSTRADSPLLNRGLQGLYPPGSVFKTVTLAAALSSGKLALNSVFTDTGRLEVQGHVISDPNRPDPARTRYTLIEGYIWSLNSVFAQAALAIGPGQLEATAKSLGFGKVSMGEFPASVSLLYRSRDFVLREPGLADTGFGQGEILATPLQMAMVASAVANDGLLPKPHLVERVVTPRGTVTYRFTEESEPVMDAEVARQVKEAMVESVRSGWARPAALPGTSVAGKTGTAENPQGPPHAWFIGFAPANDPKYVVSVVIENGGDGVSAALPVGREMLKAALALQ